MSHREGACVYEIRVQGRLAGDWSDWFEGLAIHNDDRGGAVLRGAVVDQAALIGLLTKVHALNLTITSVRRETRTETRPEAPKTD